MTAVNVTTGDPVRLMLQAIRNSDVRSLALHLERDLEWTVEGLPTLTGRGAVTDFWSRLFPRYRSVRVELRRLAEDGDLRIADQLHVLCAGDGAPIVLENIAVYHLRENRILSWRDHVDLSSAPDREVATWRKLRKVSAALAS